MALSPGINLSHTFFVEQLLFECTRDLLCNKTVEWLHFMVVSCVWLCDPMDCSPSISSVHRAFQARLPEWVTLPTPGDLPDQGTEPVSLTSPAFQKDSLSLVHLGSPTSFHEQPQIIKHVRPCLQKTGWSSSLPFQPPRVLPSYQVTSAGRHTTWTLLLCIPFKYLLRPDLMEV